MHTQIFQKLKPYYQEAFKKHQMGSPFVHWNWSAFFFSDIWLFYKRMYLNGFITVLILFLAYHFVSFLSLFGVVLLIRLFLGLYGTALFGNKLHKDIVRINSPQNDKIAAGISALGSLIIIAIPLYFLWECRNHESCGGSELPLSDSEVEQIKKLEEE